MQTPRFPFTLSLIAAGAFALTGCEKPAAPKDAEATPTPQAATPAESPAAATSPAVAVTEPVAATGSTGATVELKDPVATVNGEPVTRAELDTALGEAAQASGIKVEDLTADQKMEGYRQILDDLIMDKILTKAAADIAVSEEEVAAEITKLKAQFPSEEEFKAQLAAVGQSPEKLQTALTKLMRQRKWVESQLGTSMDVTEADIKKFYEDNKAEFENPEQVKASHILFMVKPDDKEDFVNTQLEKAKKAAASANKKGADFTALAKELSEEPGAKESGGDLGFFSKDRMVPEFSEAAFQLKPGQISQPVRTQFGWHVIKLEEKKEAGVSPFEEVKEKLGQYLKSDKQRKAVGELMEKLRADAKVDSTLPAPELPPNPTGMPMPPSAAPAAPAPGN